MHPAPIKTWVHGVNGRMGLLLVKALQEQHEFEFMGGSAKNYYIDAQQDEASELKGSQLQSFESSDLFIDFSTVEGNSTLLAMMKNAKILGKSVLIATTGLPKNQTESWTQFADKNACKILFARNTSLGIALTLQASLQTFSLLKNLNFDVEIHEKHHRYKVDAPSGTALMLAEALAAADTTFSPALSHEGGRKTKSIGLTAQRGGQIFGEHTVSFLGDHEEIHITHRALSRELFAAGALVLGKWLQQKPAGTYRIENITPSELEKTSS